MMNPTPEQQYCIDLAVAGNPLKVTAGAGTGKTSTLVEMASAMRQKRGLYLAFGTANREDADKRFPRPSVVCKTGHQLGYAGMNVGLYYKKRLEGRMTNRIAADRLSLPEFFYYGVTGRADYELSSNAMASLAIAAIANFCHSKDRVMGLQHAPWADLTIAEEQTRNEVAKQVLFYGRRLWGELCKPDSQLPITHDYYLKWWALGNPRIDRDYIMLDEAQDSNGVLLGIVEAQRHAQLILVGDRHQAIYEWRGAINAMEFDNGFKEAQLTRSFRFGPAVAETANAVLQHYLKSDFRVVGHEPIKSKVGSFAAIPDVAICRTNQLCMERIMEFQGTGVKVGMADKARKQMELLLDGAEALMAGRRTSVKDFMLFRDWAEVEEYASTQEGRDMAVLVKQIETYGLAKLKDVLLNTVRDVESDVMVTTAHKSKGMEWPSVSMGGDFEHPLGERAFTPADGNLLYVAATRAKTQLDISECEAMQHALSWSPEKDLRAEEKMMSGDLKNAAWVAAWVSASVSETAGQTWALPKLSGGANKMGEPDKELEALINKGTKAWAEVGNTNEWLEDLRRLV